MTRKAFSARRKNVKSMPRATRVKGKTEFDNGSNGGSRTPRRALNSVHRNAGCCPIPDLQRPTTNRTRRVVFLPVGFRARAHTKVRHSLDGRLGGQTWTFGGLYDIFQLKELGVCAAGAAHVRVTGKLWSGKRRLCVPR